MDVRGHNLTIEAIELCKKCDQRLCDAFLKAFIDFMDGCD